MILAIPCQFQTSLASLSELRPGTVVVDPSNRWVMMIMTMIKMMISRYARVQDGRMSHAEELARTLPPTVSLVKAFNSLEVSDRGVNNHLVIMIVMKVSDLIGDKSLVRDVCIVSDNPSARVLVSSLVTMMGHRPVDYGELSR